jgi:SAM-dependent methyltransferase
MEWAMTARIANAEMAAAWDGDEGRDWARDWQRYDAGIRGYHRRLLDAAAVGIAEHVLDIGCGNGESTRAAARLAADGTALGVDLSSLMVERARELAAAEELTNVTFEQADAQVHRFAPAAHDVVISRFGTMFFTDPVAAFTNIGAALRPGGRLVMVAWQDLAHNAWLRAIRTALAAGRDLPTPPVGAPGPFGLADPDHVRAVLSAAGFEAIRLEAVEEPFHVGADADDAFAFISSTGIVRGLLNDLTDADRRRALDALRVTMDAHETGDGVLLGSASWLISARR